jgi:uncharacterized membrane protein
VPERSEPSAVLAPEAARAGLEAQPARERTVRPVPPPLTPPQRPLPLGRLALAAAELALASASLFLCARLFAMPDAQRVSFLWHNSLATPLRNALLIQAFAAAALPLALGGAFLVRARNAAVPALVRAGELCAPLILSCFVPSLLNATQWYDKPLPYLLQLLAFVLVFERLLLRAFGGSRNPSAGYVPPTDGDRSLATRVVPLVLVVLFAAGYSAYMSYYTIMRHHLLGTAGFDLGIFDNLMFNAMHGRPFRSTVAVPLGSYLSNHAEYGMFLFVPLYALHPGPEFMLVLQSTMIGFAAVPLYFFCSTQLPRTAAAALSIAYLFYAPLHGPNFYDFHWMPVAMFFFHWLFYAIAKRKPIATALLMLVCLSMREDAALGVIVAGLFLIVTRYWVRAGVWLALVSTLWFLLVKFVIMPWAGPWWFADIYKELVAEGERGYGSIVKTILINPNYFIKTLLTEPKFIYALHLLAPLALLPLRHAALALLMLPGFFVSLMTTGYAPTVSIAFQYTTTWIPFLFAASAIALRQRTLKLGAAGRSATTVAVCAGVLIHSYVYGAILQHDTFIGGFSRVFFSMSEGERKRYQDLEKITALIPPGAVVAATEQEIPHVSTRLDAYTLKITAGNPEYILVHRLHLDNEAKQQVRSALRLDHYGLVKRQGDFFLFRKGFDSPDTDAALRALGLHGAQKH